MKIYVGADHRGFSLKKELVEFLRSTGYDVVDEGDEQLKPEDDFPQFAGKVATGVLGSDDQDARGILLCGSGQGMCMAANRFKGIRAALAIDADSAKTTRNDDDSNVLCLPADILKKDKANQIVETWLSTPFAGASRFIRRNKEMDELG